ncbi:MAG: FAD-dependent oxidoreductase, partial [Elainellaceae cyanobacterium]
VHSPRDRQVHPQQLTLALLDAARQQGAQMCFDAEVLSIDEKNGRACATLASEERHEADWLVLTAGLGTTALASSATIDIRPVLGQAVEVAMASPLEPDEFRPVVTGNDIHVVQLTISQSTSEQSPPESRYWVGATVEFPRDGDEAAIEAELQTMWAGAIALHPTLASATILRIWWGKRPRPFNRPAPIIERLPGYSRVIIASGHYRNGVLLAPATAQKVTELLQED